MKLLLNLKLSLWHAERHMSQRAAVSCLAAKLLSNTDQRQQTLKSQATALSTSCRASEYRGSGGIWWPVAGLAALLSGRAEAAYAEESRDQQPDQATNRSTAQWRLYTDIGRDLVKKGDTSKAEMYLKRALKEAKAGFGEGDGHVAAALNNLAELYRIMERFSLAEPMYLESLKILELAHGSKDPRFASASLHVAAFYQQQMLFVEARTHYMQALQAVAGSLGQHHPMYAQVLIRYADLERMTDDKSAAIALLQQAIEVLDAQGPPSAQEALVTGNKLGQLLVMNGQSEAGIAVLRRCVQQAEGLDSEPELSPMLPFCLASLADALQRNGDLAGAREILHRAISLKPGHGMHSRSLPDLMVATANVELELGQKSQDRDSFLRAHNLAQQAVDSYQKAWRQLLTVWAGGKPKRSSWLPFSAKSPQPATEPTSGSILMAYLMSKAFSTLALAQQKLDRRSEAEKTLKEGLQLLASPLAAPKEAEGSALEIQDREPRWQEKEIQRLQLVIDFLHTYLQLLGKGQSTELVEVRQHLSTLCKRLPGVDQPQAEADQGISPQLRIVLRARQQLNALQSEINKRKRQSAAEGQKQRYPEVLQSAKSA